MACEVCAAPKDSNECGSCGAPVCKNCVVFNPPERYHFHPAPPPELKHEIFCVPCHERDAAPVLAKYDEVLAKAADVTVISKFFRGQIPTLKVARGKNSVDNHIDVKDAVLHLQFLAAWEGYDSVIKLETVGTKVRNFGYEKKSWAATGLFACLDHRRFRPEG